VIAVKDSFYVVPIWQAKIVAFMLRAVATEAIRISSSPARLPVGVEVVPPRSRESAPVGSVSVHHIDV
jgi:hypothetical protein